MSQGDNKDKIIANLSSRLAIEKEENNELYVAMCDIEENILESCTPSYKMPEKKIRKLGGTP